MVDALGDPLVHLVRNSLDHGLEGPEERVAAGKPATGTLEISARHAGGNVVITVRDDGRGIDPAQGRRARRPSAASSPPTRSSTIDMARAIELLFPPGFSTAEVTSDISGRGVGMDAVRTTIRELGGEVLMTSEPGQGTDGPDPPAADAGDHGRAARRGRRPRRSPSRSTASSAPSASPTTPSARWPARRMLVMRDGVLPIVDAAERFGAPRRRTDAEYAVIVRGGDGALAVTVTALVGQRELVTRPLPPEVADGLRPVGRRRAVRRADRADRRLRRHRDDVRPASSAA